MCFIIYTPVQNSIQQRQKFSDEIFITLASITLILIRIIEFEIKTKGNLEKMQFLISNTKILPDFEGF